MNWYVAKNANDTQGLVVNEDTGENIAVSYKAEDARLIAAAPELLEALERIIKWSELQEMKHGMTHQNNKIAELARAAIAKAKGG